MDPAPRPPTPFDSKALDPGRPPQPVRPGLWWFAPSRESQGGSAWWLDLGELALLVDCPAWTQANLTFLRQQADRGVTTWIVLTGREGHGRCRRFQEALDWPVLVQEQEAYLLPGVRRLLPFASEHQLAEGVRLLWTPGPSPGASVLHVTPMDGLFCGRLLVPVGPGQLAPLRSRRTFHWPRQLASLTRLRAWLPTGSPAWIACGAGLGGLRGEKLVPDGAGLLAELERQFGGAMGPPAADWGPM